MGNGRGGAPLPDPVVLPEYLELPEGTAEAKGPGEFVRNPPKMFPVFCCPRSESCECTEDVQDGVFRLILT